MTRLTREQEMLLAQIEAAKQEEEVLFRIKEAEWKEYKAKYAYPKTFDLVRLAAASGVPRTRIGRAYGSKDAATITRIIEADVATPGALLNAFVSKSTALASTQKAEVIHTYLRPGDPDFPAFLGENRTFSKIQATFPENGPFSKIRGLSAVVDPAYKICCVSEPTPLTDLIDGPRENWPAELEDVLGPVLDNYNPQA